jgi:hypothetical protein
MSVGGREEERKSAENLLREHVEVLCFQKRKDCERIPDPKVESLNPEAVQGM